MFNVPGIEGEPPICSANKAAESLLRYANPPTRVREICFEEVLTPRNILDLDERFAAVTQGGDGILYPFISTHRQAWKKVRDELKSIGINVAKCTPQSLQISDDPKQNVYRIILHSYSLKKTSPKSGLGSEYKGNAAYYAFVDREVYTIVIIGVSIENPNPMNSILHELGHVLGLEHSPFDVYHPCAHHDYSGFLTKAKQLARDLKCQVPLRDNCAEASVMHCDLGPCPDSGLSAGDKLAFAHRYKLMTSGIPDNQCPTEMNSKPQQPIYYTPPVVEQFPVVPIMQAGFWLASKFGLCQRVTNFEPIKFLDPFSAKIHQQDMRRRSVESTLQREGTTLDEVLRFLVRYQITASEKQEIQEFVIDVLSGNVNSGIRSKFFSLANIPNHHLRNKEMYRLYSDTRDERMLQKLGFN